MAIDWAKMKKSTISLILLVMSGTLSVQVDWVKNHIIPMLANHPHLSTIGSGLIIILTLLHNPETRIIIEKLTAEEVTETPSGDTTTTTVTKEIAKTP